MLKITQNGTAAEQRWTLCGQLSGPWVAELRSAWESGPNEPGAQKSIVDLSEVTSIDERGEELLRCMQEDGAQFVAQGVDMKHILEHLNSKGQRPLRRFLTHLSNCE
jgi:hypothetical protein